MPSGLRRFHPSRQAHFLTFSCYRREPRFRSAAMYDWFVRTLEDTRVRFSLRVYAYVVMPEHVHLLWSEPDRGTLADAMHFLKLSFSKRVRSVMAPQVARVLGKLTSVTGTHSGRNATMIATRGTRRNSGATCATFIAIRSSAGW
jgi:REP element-mobilizing transposase RayT